MSVESNNEQFSSAPLIESGLITYRGLFISHGFHKFQGLSSRRANVVHSTLLEAAD